MKNAFIKIKNSIDRLERAKRALTNWKIDLSRNHRDIKR